MISPKNNSHRRAFAIALLLTILSALTACAPTQSSAPPHELSISADYSGTTNKLATVTQVLKTTLKDSPILVVQHLDHVSLILPSYYIFINKDRINKICKPDLQQLIQILKIYNPTSIEIIGYTDNADTLQQNLALSKSWANTMVKYLVKHGISREQITMEGRGSLRPLADNYTSAGQLQNRRVEILIYM